MQILMRLTSLITLWLCMVTSFTVHAATEADAAPNSLNTFVEQLSQTAAEPLYNLEMEQLQQTLQLALQLRPTLRGVVVTDVISGQEVLKLLNQEGDIAPVSTFPPDISTLEQISREIEFAGQSIGIIRVFYSAESPINSASAVGKPLEIAFCIDCVPFQFVDDEHKPAGLIIELWRIWSEKTGRKIHFKPYDWEQSLAAVRDREADVHAGLFYNEQRDTYLDYGLALTNATSHAFVRSGLASSENFRDTDIDKIGVLSGDFLEGHLKTLVDPSAIKTYANYQEMMADLANKQLDVFAADTLTALYHLKRASLDQQFELKTENILLTEAWYAAVPEGDSQLLAEINKGFDLISQQEKIRVFTNWDSAALTESSSGGESGFSGANSGVVFFATVLVIFGVIIILGTSLVLPRLFKDEFIAKLVSSNGFKYSIVSLIGVFSFVLIFVVGITIKENERSTLKSIEEDLRFVLNGTTASLNSWVDDRKNYLSILSQDRDLLVRTQALLRESPDPQRLLTSEHQAALRAFFEKRGDQFGELGFFIIDRDGLTRASSRDSAVGQANIIAEERSDLLELAFDGKAVFVPPVENDQLAHRDPNWPVYMRDLIMFFLAPITDENGEVIAILAQKHGPADGLSRIMQQGRLGSSGESYAVSKNGELLSSSRFNRTLAEIGLIREAPGSSIIKIRDPGGNLLEGYKPQRLRDSQPLTPMAASITEIAAQPLSPDQLNIYSNMDGYRDYRGVPVLGVWRWDPRLGIGLTTEIDVAEALAPHNSMKTNIIATGVSALVLAMVATLIALSVGQRATSFMKRSKDELEAEVLSRTEELRKSKDQFKNLLESTPDPMIVANAKGGILMINNRALELFGYDLIELIGAPVEQLMPARFANHHDKLREGYIEDPGVREMGQDQELVVLTKSGQEIPVEISLSPIQSEMGLIVVASIRDITERKIQEDLRKAAQERISLLLESIGEGIWGVGEDGLVNFINPAALEMLGFEESEVLGQKIHPLVHHTLPDGSLYPQEECPMHMSLREGREIFVDDEVLWRKDGTCFPAEYTARPIYKDGVISGSVVTVRNLSHRKLMEQSLKDSMERFDLAVAGSGDGLWEHNPVDGTNWWSPKLWEMYGYDEPADIDTYALFMSSIHPEDKDEVVAAQARLLKGIGEHDVTYRILRKDGRLVWHRSRGKAIFDEAGRAIKASGSVSDVTNLKELELELRAAMEKAEEATKAKSDFLANMSHEIRTPMNAVIGMSYLALQTELSPRQKDYLQKINNAANSLLGIINDILDFSKIEAGKMDIENLPFNLEETLNNLSTTMQVKAQEKNLELMVHAEPDVPLGLSGDPLRLGQILINLVNNAIKFTEQGEIVVRAALEHRAGSDVMLHFSVTDSGIGMTPDQVSRLFQSFQQADASTTRKYGGTGLGLSISKQLTEMMHGEIWVESEYGKGSVFHFTVRLGLAKEAENDRLVADADLRGLPVLILDDSPAARQIMTQTLESLTFEPMVASSGAEALELVKRNDDRGYPFSLAFVDWKMPEMDGIEFNKRMRALSLKSPPKVILVTAYDTSEMMRLAGSSVAGVLTKPTTSSSILDAAMVALGRVSEGETTSRGDGEQNELLAISVSGANVLLVEDNEINQQVARELLERAGMQVDIAENGRIAVQKAKSSSYDIILMDLQMPVMDGFEASREIRKDASLASVPIVAMTANAMAGDKERCIDAGMQEHVAKPIHPPTLYRALVDWIAPREGLGGVDLTSINKHSETADEALPSIDGLHQEIGLARLAGNIKLYRDLLFRFAKDQSSAIAEIEEALSDSDLATAERVAHTIKGVAGNLGAEPIQMLAAELEQHLKEQNLDAAKSLIPSLDDLIQAVVAQINAYREQFEAKTESGTEVDSVEVLSLAMQLHDLLKDDDGESEELFQENRKVLHSAMREAEFDSLAEAIESFDFEAALAVLTPLLTELAAQASDQPDFSDLLALLQDDDGDSVDLYEAQKAQLKSALDHESFSALEEAIEQFDFDAAAGVLSVYQAQHNETT